MDDLLLEIQDSQGEIFDLPELKDEDDSQSFNKLLNSTMDF